MIEKDVLKFGAEGREFAKILRSLKQFIRTVKGQKKFQAEFLLRSNTSEQLEFKLEKIIWIWKHPGKVRK